MSMILGKPVSSLRKTKINGVDLDTSTEQEPEIPDYPPPQPPSSEPPIEQKGQYIRLWYKVSQSVV